MFYESEKMGRELEKEWKKAVKKRQRGPTGKEWEMKVERPKTAEDWKEFKEESLAEAGRGVAENALEMVWEETGLPRPRCRASAEVVTARVEVGIAHTPLQARVQGPAAGAEAGASWDYTGVGVGASLAEARAGPFAARAGVKIGAGVRNGVPEVDLGPVTMPCSIM